MLLCLCKTASTALSTARSLIEGAGDAVCGVLLKKHPCTPKTFNKGIFYGRIVPKKRRLNTTGPFEKGTPTPL